jgi:hypothetical protein
LREHGKLGWLAPDDLPALGEADTIVPLVGRCGVGDDQGGVGRLGVGA